MFYRIDVVFTLPEADEAITQAREFLSAARKYMGIIGSEPRDGEGGDDN